MEEVIDLSATALLCGKKKRPSIKEDLFIDSGFIVTEFAQATTEDGDVDSKPVFRKVDSRFRLTPRICSKDFSLTTMLSTGVVPQVVPTCGSLGKVDAALFANDLASKATVTYDTVIEAVKARQAAEEAAQKAASSAPVSSVEPSKTE